MYQERALSVRGDECLQGVALYSFSRTIQGTAPQPDKFKGARSVISTAVLPAP